MEAIVSRNDDIIVGSDESSFAIHSHTHLPLQVSLFDSSTPPRTYMAKNGRQLSDRPELGLLSTRQILSGDPILALPRTLWVSDSQVVPQHPATQSGSGSQSGYQSGSGLSTTVILALWLIRNRYPPPGQSGSGCGFWDPYIELLPHSSPQPVGWGEESLGEVDFEPVINEVRMGSGVVARWRL